MFCGDCRDAFSQGSESELDGKQGETDVLKNLVGFRYQNHKELNYGSMREGPPKQSLGSGS